MWFDTYYPGCTIYDAVGIEKSDVIGNRETTENDDNTIWIVASTLGIAAIGTVLFLRRGNLTAINPKNILNNGKNDGGDNTTSSTLFRNSGQICCANCNESIKESVKFCPSCGLKQE